MNLHRLNNQGMAQFNQFLDALSGDPGTPVPNSLLGDPLYVETVGTGVDVEARQFTNRMEAARYLDGLLGAVSGHDVQRDVGLWSWLTLFYFDQICPPDVHQHRKVHDRARYIPAIDNYQKYYRHLLAGPCRVFRAHRDNPDRALVLLCGPLHKPGDIAEQLVSRQQIITNPQAVELATAIYYDPATGSFRRGAAGKGGGSARRLVDVLNQFDVTWDLYWMTRDRIRAKLPKEFVRFTGSVA